jgi:GNAT superfamily N-acetyltransferase
MSSAIEVTHPAANELEAVLHAAFQHVAPQEAGVRINMIMQLFREGRVDLNGVFQAKENGKLAGAMYAQKRPDGSVMLWVPAMEKGISLEPFLEPLEKFCCSQKAFAAVALADRTQIFDEQVFCRAGQFRHLSDLIYLVAEISPEEPPPELSRLQFVPFSIFSPDCSEKIADRLTRLVSETYKKSLDFPDLMQIAPVEDVLRGYKTGSLYRPELWFFVQNKETDIGVLFLTDAPPDQFELTYMGLIASARRQGFSREIVQFAKQTTRAWKRSLLLTSVDEKNIPASQCYLSLGFRAWDRKKVYARFSLIYNHLFCP